MSTKSRPTSHTTDASGITAHRPARRGLCPRWATAWFNSMLPAGAQPLYGGRQLRPFDADEDALGAVTTVTPAFPFGSLVSIDHLSDGSHLVVEATSRRGAPVHLLVCNCGWLPLAKVAPVRACTDGPAFTYNTNVPREVAALQLSPGDRQKIVAALLGQFIGAADWDRLQAWRRRRALAT